MTTNDPLAPMARLARRIPGYPAVRRVLVPRVRSSAVFRAIAHKLWLTEIAVDGRGADLTPGNLVAGVGAHTLPVILFAFSEVPEALIDGVVDDIAALQVLTAGFRPVLLLRWADFGCARKYGYPAELIPPMSVPEIDSVKYWRRLRDAYGTALVCEIPAQGLTQIQRAFLMSLARES